MMYGVLVAVSSVEQSDNGANVPTSILVGLSTGDNIDSWNALQVHYRRLYRPINLH